MSDLVHCEKCGITYDSNCEVCLCDYGTDKEKSVTS